MESMEQELEAYFLSNVLACASRLQSTHPDDAKSTSSFSVYPAEKFGHELLECMQGLSPPKASTQTAIDQYCYTLVSFVYRQLPSFVPT